MINVGVECDSRRCLTYATMTVDEALFEEPRAFLERLRAEGWTFKLGARAARDRKSRLRVLCPSCKGARK